MRNCVLAEKSRLLLRGAAIVVLAGFATGCSSDLSRFTYKDFTGSVSRANPFHRSAKPQPFPDAPLVGQKVSQDVSSSDGFDAPAVPSSVTRRALAPVAAAGSAVAATTKRLTAPVVEAAKSVIAPVSPARQTVTPVDLAAVEELPAAPLAPKVKLIRKKLAEEAKALDSGATGTVAPKVRKVELVKPKAEPLSVSEEADAAPKVKKPVAVAAAKPAIDKSNVDRGGWTREGGTEITVREGETLYNYSKRFGVPVVSLLKANGLTDAGQVKVGQKFLVPAYHYSKDSDVSAPDSNFDTAAAKSSSGTVYDVSQEKVPLPKKAPARENVAVLPTVPQVRQKTAAPVQLTAAEPKTTPKTDRLKVVAPVAEQAAAPVEKAPRQIALAVKAPEVVEKPAAVKLAVVKPVVEKVETAKIEPPKRLSAGPGEYAVAQGDSLYKIAKSHGVSVDALKQANGLADGHLKIGQPLRIPAVGVAVAAAPKVDPIQTSAAGQSAKLVKPAIAQEAKAEQPEPQKNDVVTAEADQDKSAAPNATGISKLRWPVRGRTLTGYGQRDAGVVNDGIDISAPAGTPIKAAENGVVIYAGSGLKEFGNTVLVRHADGIVTVYGHADQLKVKRGQTIKRGEELATTGMSGNAKSPMLHFEVRKNSAPVNPASYLE
jgi:murein DD-endopeptidase MepM/ murein hydrolase activator NlpD